MMKKSIFLALLAIVWVVNPVWAQKPGSTTSPSPDVKRSCEQREAKINFRLKQSQETRDKHYKVFQGVQKRLNTLVEKNQAAGCDMATTKEKLVKFDTLIQEFAASYRDFSTSMQATRENRCNGADANFSKSTKLSNQKMSVVKQKSEAVHVYFKTTIQPELSQKMKACASSKPTAKPSPATRGGN